MFESCEPRPLAARDAIFELIAVRLTAPFFRSLRGGAVFPFSTLWHLVCPRQSREVVVHERSHTARADGSVALDRLPRLPRRSAGRSFAAQHDRLPEGDSLIGPVASQEFTREGG